MFYSPADALRKISLVAAMAALVVLEGNAATAAQPARHARPDSGPPPAGKQSIAMNILRRRNLERGLPLWRRFTAWGRSSFVSPKALPWADLFRPFQGNPSANFAPKGPRQTSPGQRPGKCVISPDLCPEGATQRDPLSTHPALDGVRCGREIPVISTAFTCPENAHGSDQQSFLGVKPGDEREVCGVKLCWCPPGRFTMGSPPGEPERRPGEDQVEVTLTSGFWVGKYEVTQSQWKKVVGEFPGKLTAGEGDDFPVYNINFAEAEGFCRKLTENSRAAGDLPKEWEFRLPTEAQWEYACRAGTTTATAFGDKLSSKQANFQGQPYNGAEPGPSLKRAAPVGSYPANAWGVHDMHGNVFEWCRDLDHARPPGGVDPDFYDTNSRSRTGQTGSASSMRRGGCWADEGWPCRSALRARFEPERRSDHIGFRVVAVQLREKAR